jgi:ribosomal-protein-alanine N-acetyltransferase
MEKCSSGSGRTAIFRALRKPAGTQLSGWARRCQASFLRMLGVPSSTDSGTLDYRRRLSLAMVEARTGTAAGLMCLLHREQPGVVGVGYWIVASRRRKGLTLASLVLLSRWALRLSAVDRLETLVDPGSEASIRVLYGAGFRQEALLRSYREFEGHRRDAVLYALLESDIERPTSK